MKNKNLPKTKSTKISTSDLIVQNEKLKKKVKKLKRLIYDLFKIIEKSK